MNRELDLLYPVTKEQKEASVRHRLAEEKRARESIIPGPPKWAKPGTPGPPKKLPIPPPLFHSRGGPPSTLPGPPPRPNALPGPPPTALPGPPPPQYPLPGAPIRKKRLSANSRAPVKRSSLPAAPPAMSSGPPGMQSSPKRMKVAASGARPPSVPSAPSFVPSSGNRQSRGPPTVPRAPSFVPAGAPPPVPSAPSFVPGRSPKKTKSFRGNVLRATGSLHTIRKGHVHDGHEAHARHRPPALRFQEHQ